MAVLRAINFIVCTALVLFSCVCALRGDSAAIRILHLYSAEYDTGEAALSVEQRISRNINISLPQAHVTVTEVQDMRVSKKTLIFICVCSSHMKLFAHLHEMHMKAR